MKAKKLCLNKETIRNLSDENLEQVAGGKRKGGGDTGVGVCESAICHNTKANQSCIGICVNTVAGVC